MYCICVQYLTAGCLSNFEIVCKFKVHVQEVESNTADALKGIMVISFIPLSSLGAFLLFVFSLYFSFDNRGCPGQLARTSTNRTDSEVNG